MPLSYWGKLSTCHQLWEDNVSHLSQTLKPGVTIPEGWRTQITKFKCNFRISCLLSKFPGWSPGIQSTWKQNKTKCNIRTSVWRVHCANLFEKPGLLVISATVEGWALTAQTVCMAAMNKVSKMLFQSQRDQFGTWACVSFAVSNTGLSLLSSKFHIYVLVYCIGVFLYGLLHSV